MTKKVGKKILNDAGFQNLDKFLPFFKTLMIMTKKVGKKLLNDAGFQNLDKFLPFF